MEMLQVLIGKSSFPLLHNRFDNILQIHEDKDTKKHRDGR